jgi:hypothetical protein
LTGNVPTGRWRYETYKRANGDARGTKEILSSYANDEKVALVVIGQHGVTNKVRTCVHAHTTYNLTYKSPYNIRAIYEQQR